MKKRPDSLVASPSDLAIVLRDLADDLEAIAPMYVRLTSMGLEGERRGTVEVSGGSPSDPTGSLAVDSDLARRRREYAKWVTKEILRAARALDRVRQGLDRNVGPGPGFRQPRSLGSDAIVTVAQFYESLGKQEGRLREGSE